MDEKYIEDLYNNLGGEEAFGKYESFKSLISTDSEYRKDVYDQLGGESVFGKFDSFEKLTMQNPKSSVSVGEEAKLKKKDSGEDFSWDSLLGSQGLQQIKDGNVPKVETTKKEKTSTTDDGQLIQGDVTPIDNLPSDTVKSAAKESWLAEDNPDNKLTDGEKAMRDNERKIRAFAEQSSASKRGISPTDQSEPQYNIAPQFEEEINSKASELAKKYQEIFTFKEGQITEPLRKRYEDLVKAGSMTLEQANEAFNAERSALIGGLQKEYQDKFSKSQEALLKEYELKTSKLKPEDSSPNEPRLYPYKVPFFSDLLTNIWDKIANIAPAAVEVSQIEAMEDLRVKRDKNGNPYLYTENNAGFLNMAQSREVSNDIITVNKLLREGKTFDEIIEWNNKPLTPVISGIVRDVLEMTVNGASPEEKENKELMLDRFIAMYRKAASEVKQDKYAEILTQLKESEEILSGTVKTWDEAKGFKGVLDFLGSAVGNAGGSALASAPVGMVTGVRAMEMVESYKRNVDAEAARMTALSGIPVTASDIIATGNDVEAMRVAGNVGNINAALETIGFALGAGKLAQGIFTRKVMEAMTRKGLAKKFLNVAAGTAAGGAGEFATETVQALNTAVGEKYILGYEDYSGTAMNGLIGIMNKMIGRKVDEGMTRDEAIASFSDDEIQQWLDEGLMGLAGGAIMAAGGVVAEEFAPQKANYISNKAGENGDFVTREAAIEQILNSKTEEEVNDITANFDVDVQQLQKEKIEEIKKSQQADQSQGQKEGENAPVEGQESQRDPILESVDGVIVDTKEKGSINKFVEETAKSETTAEGRFKIRQIGRAMDMAAKTLSSVLPDLKFVVTRNQQQLQEAAKKNNVQAAFEEGEVTNGFFDNATGTIYLNLDAMSPSTALHEAIHPVMNGLFQANREAYNSYAEQLANSGMKVQLSDGKVVPFLEAFEGDMDEAMVAFMENIVDGQIDYSTPIGKKTAGDVVVDLVKMLLPEKYANKASEFVSAAIGRTINLDKVAPADFKDLANMMADVFAGGKIVEFSKEGVDVKLNPIALRKQEKKKSAQEKRKATQAKKKAQKENKKDETQKSVQFSIRKSTVGDMLSKASGTTQVATTTGSYSKAAKIIKGIGISGDVLDYGAGLGLGTDEMTSVLGRDVDSLEVNPERWQGKKGVTYTDSSEINKKYDAIVSLNVVNVVPKDIRDFIVRDIFDKLNVNGVAVISSRKFKGDIDTAKNFERGDEDKSYIIKRSKDGKTIDVFQKGFDGNELVEYVQELLGDEAEVRKDNSFGATGVVITKRGKPVDGVNKFNVQDEVVLSEENPDSAESGDVAFAGEVDKEYIKKKPKPKVQKSIRELKNLGANNPENIRLLNEQKKQGTKPTFWFTPVRDLPTKTLQEALANSNNRAIVINSDPSKTGWLTLPSGKKIFMKGGIMYTAIGDNIDGKVGFAASKDSKLRNYVTALKKTGAKKGDKVLVMVMTQKPESMFGNAYALEYVLDAITVLDTLPEGKEFLKSQEFKDDFFGTGLIAVKSAFPAGEYEKFVNKYSNLDLSDPKNLEDMKRDLLADIGSNFAARTSLVKNLLLNWTTTKFETAKINAKNRAEHPISMMLKEKLGIDAKSVAYALGEKDILDAYFNGGGTWGLTASGYYTTIDDASKWLDETNKFNKKHKADNNDTNPDGGEYFKSINVGTEHPQFNSKFHGVEPFKLDGVYEVNPMFKPDHRWWKVSEDKKTGENVVDKPYLTTEGDAIWNGRKNKKDEKKSRPAMSEKDKEKVLRLYDQIGQNPLKSVKVDGKSYKGVGGSVVDSGEKVTYITEDKEGNRTKVTETALEFLNKHQKEFVVRPAQLASQAMYPAEKIADKKAASLRPYATISAEEAISKMMEEVKEPAPSKTKSKPVFAEETEAVQKSNATAGREIRKIIEGKNNDSTPVALDIVNKIISHKDGSDYTKIAKMYASSPDTFGHSALVLPAKRVKGQGSATVSYYHPIEHTINMDKNTSDELYVPVFLHEYTHALTYHKIPKMFRGRVGDSYRDAVLKYAAFGDDPNIRKIASLYLEATDNSQIRQYLFGDSGTVSIYSGFVRDFEEGKSIALFNDPIALRNFVGGSISEDGKVAGIDIVSDARPFEFKSGKTMYGYIVDTNNIKEFISANREYELKELDSSGRYMIMRNKEVKVGLNLANDYRSTGDITLPTGQKNYGFINIDEFLSEVFTNPDFQEVLNSMTVVDNESGNVSGGMDALVDAISDIMIPAKNKEVNTNSILAKLIEYGANVINTQIIASRILETPPVQFSNKTTKFIENLREESIKNGTFLKAPNGAPSNLNEWQWLVVRTPEFKNWFGDWENSPETSSQAIDENLEPKVYHHGTPYGMFDEFKYKGKRDTGFLGEAFYFSKDKEIASAFTSRIENDIKSKKKKHVFDVFLNVRKPLVISNRIGADDVILMIEKYRQSNGFTPLSDSVKNDIINDFDGAYSDKYVEKRLKDYSDPSKLAEANGYDGIFGATEKAVSVFRPNQIKLADGSNTTFNPESSKIQKSAVDIASFGEDDDIKVKEVIFTNKNLSTYKRYVVFNGWEQMKTFYKKEDAIEYAKMLADHIQKSTGKKIQWVLNDTARKVSEDETASKATRKAIEDRRQDFEHIEQNQNQMFENLQNMPLTDLSLELAKAVDKLNEIKGGTNNLPLVFITAYKAAERAESLLRQQAEAAKAKGDMTTYNQKMKDIDSLGIDWLFKNISDIGTYLGQALRQLSYFSVSPYKTAVSLIDKVLKQRGATMTDAQREMLKRLFDEFEAARVAETNARQAFDSNPSVATSDGLIKAISNTEQAFNKANNYANRLLSSTAGFWDKMILMMQLGAMSVPSLLRNVVGNIVYAPVWMGSSIIRDLGSSAVNRQKSLRVPVLETFEAWAAGLVFGLFNPSTWQNIWQHIKSGQHSITENEKLRKTSVGIHPVDAWQDILNIVAGKREYVPKFDSKLKEFEFWSGRMMEAIVGWASSFISSGLYLTDAPVRAMARASEQFRQYVNSGGTGRAMKLRGGITFSDDYLKWIENNRDNEYVADAMEKAERDATWTQEGFLSTIVNNVVSGINKALKSKLGKANGLARFAIKTQSLFTTVPANLIEATIGLILPQMSLGAGLFNLGKAVKGQIKAAKAKKAGHEFLFKESKAEADNYMEKAARGLTVAMTGFAIQGLTKHMVVAGAIVANLDDDSPEDKQWKYKLFGGGNRINIPLARLAVHDYVHGTNLAELAVLDDKWIELAKKGTIGIEYLGAIGVAMGAIANRDEVLRKQGKSLEDINLLTDVVALTGEAGKMALTLPFLESYSNMYKAITEEGFGRFAAGVIETMTYAPVPRLITDTVRPQAEIMKKVEDKNTFNMVYEKLKNRMKGDYGIFEIEPASGSYDIIDMWGEPVDANSLNPDATPMDRWMDVWFNAMKNRQMSDDTVALEVLKAYTELDFTSRQNKFPITSVNPNVRIPYIKDSDGRRTLMYEMDGVYETDAEVTADSEEFSFSYRMPEYDMVMAQILAGRTKRAIIQDMIEVGFEDEETLEFVTWADATPYQKVRAIKSANDMANRVTKKFMNDQAIMAILNGEAEFNEFADASKRQDGYTYKGEYKNQTEDFLNKLRMGGILDKPLLEYRKPWSYQDAEKTLNKMLDSEVAEDLIEGQTGGDIRNRVNKRFPE